MSAGAWQQPKHKRIIPAEKRSNVLPEAVTALNQLFVVDFLLLLVCLFCGHFERCRLVGDCASQPKIQLSDRSFGYITGPKPPGADLPSRYLEPLLHIAMIAIG